MTVLGNSATPGAGSNDSSSYNQVCADSNNLNSPAFAIVVTKLWAYFGMQSGSASGKLCIWGTGSSLLYASQTFTVTSGRTWRSVVPSTTVVLAANTHCFVGFWVPSGSPITFAIRSTGNWQGRQSVASASSMTGSTDPGSPFIQGEFGGYLEYVPASVYYGDSGGVPQQIKDILYGASGGVPTSAAGMWAGDSGGVPYRIR